MFTLFLCLIISDQGRSGICFQMTSTHKKWAGGTANPVTFYLFQFLLLFALTRQQSCLDSDKIKTGERFCCNGDITMTVNMLQTNASLLKSCQHSHCLPAQKHATLARSTVENTTCCVYQIHNAALDLNHCPNAISKPGLYHFRRELLI